MPCRAAAASLCLLACTTVATAPRDPDGPPALPTWRAHMERIEALCDDVQRLLPSTEPGDLKRASVAAREAAQAMQLGYRDFERRTVPGYARLARDAENWLLQVALEARQGHQELATAQFQQGRGTHCTQCHEAVERLAR
jgi:hypothetical protein